MEMEPSRFASYRRIVARGRHITLTLAPANAVVRRRQEIAINGEPKC
jgi:hypothetical protein